MSRKPYVTYYAEEVLSINDSRECITFDSYSELRKNIKMLIHKSYYNTLIVYRQRRGEWGEWFEYWGIENNKPVIVESGWM